ncbi:MAG: AAA family ATPase [Anaerolineae bacterium]
MIEEIKIANFRSFGDELALRLSPFSVFVGPNAAGKSNLIDAFRFLRDCVAGGLEAAVAHRGGWPILRCKRRRQPYIHFEVAGNRLDGSATLVMREQQRFHNPHFTYSLTFNGELTVVAESGSLSGIPEGSEEPQEISGFNRDQEVVEIREWSEEPKKIPVGKGLRRALFVHTHFVSYASYVISDALQGLRFYDPQLQQARQPVESQPFFEPFVSETGGNLAAVLHTLRSDNGETRERIRLLLQDMVPGFEDWRTKRLADGSIAFEVQERRMRGALPPAAVSDGTIRLLILLIALLRPPPSSTAIFLEEPERNLHPLLLEPLVQVMREVSSQMQIIVTTHSAEFVRYCWPEEVYLMDKVEGCTRIVRADSVEHIQDFLQHWTLDELWLQGYLEGGRP